MDSSMPATPLAPYAVGHDRPAGRCHQESLDPDRNPFHIDRQRVVHSTAFRRLEYKTQVFVTQEHDHFRTRLTHTLEVAEIARRLACALGVNQGLAEAIALAHDLGHSPFGHAGETVLNRLMADHGGFEHNAQSLRVVDYLEHPFPPFRGLNLCLDVRHGLLRHESTYDHPQDSTQADPNLAALLAKGPQPAVEGQIVSLADRLAYNCHDLEDALGAGLIDEQALFQVQLWDQAAGPIHRAYPQANLPAVRRPILNAMTDALVVDAVQTTRHNIDQAGFTTLEAINHHSRPMVGLSDPVEALLGDLERFLRQNVYQHPKLVEMDARADRTVSALFAALLHDPTRLPQRFADRIPDQGPHRVICDYVAGMTDRFCEQQRHNLCGPL